MDIFKNNDTGVRTAQGRPCNAFSFNLNIRSSESVLVFELRFYEVEADAINNLAPNNIRNIHIPITTQSTFSDCVSSLFSGSPYPIGDEIINLSNAKQIGKYLQNDKSTV